MPSLGIKVLYSKGHIQKIGDTSGRSFSVPNTDSEPVETVCIYTDEDRSAVVGIRIIKQTKKAVTYGRETEYLRAIVFPQDSRLTGINGRDQENQVVALGFSYIASEKVSHLSRLPNSLGCVFQAFDPDLYTGKTKSQTATDARNTSGAKKERTDDLDIYDVVLRFGLVAAASAPLMILLSLLAA